MGGEGREEQVPGLAKSSQGSWRGGHPNEAGGTGTLRGKQLWEIPQQSPEQPAEAGVQHGRLTGSRTSQASRPGMWARQWQPGEGEGRVQSPVGGTGP